ncbi:MAG: hypothetical protein ACPH5S_05070 [Candidatus Poseidoniaceae archaeon]
MSKVTDFVERVKTERDAQILVAGILFFTIAFPVAFASATNGVESGGLTAVGDYVVNGEVETILLENGGEYIQDGDEWPVSQTSDAVRNEIETAGGNVVGIRITLTYDEDESTSGTCIAGAGNDAADTITATLEHNEMSESGSGENPGSHTVDLTWVNLSLLDEEVVSGLSGSNITDQLTAGDAGLGAYDIVIGVTAQAGNAPSPVCSRSDNGEDVSWTIELLVLDFTVAPFIEVDPTL